MRASANLRNWLAFLDLRMAPNAQWEIRQYANVVARLIEDLFPRTYALFSG
jgi:thymidylate synthase ThyX